MTETATDSKACTRCDVTKPLDAFPPNKYRPAGLQSWCRDCCAEYRRETRANSPDQRAYDRAQNRAYSTALRMLRLRHPAEFDDLYDQALRNEGLA